MRLIFKGGKGSGNFGHSGRSGLVGGSSTNGIGRGTPGSEESYEYDSKSKKKISNHFNEFLESELDGPAWKGASDQERSEVKSNIVENLSQIGANPETVEDMLYAWSNSSNDHNEKSLMLQTAVSEEFDIPLSDWQKKNIENYMNPAQYNINGEEYESTVRSMYEHTQYALEEFGFGKNDVIRVYRGILTDVDLDEGGAYEWDGNAIESWSIDRNIAKQFSGNAGGSMRSYIITMEVPRSAIFSTARTGLGCLTEGEIVIFGSVGHEVYVEWKI